MRRARLDRREPQGHARGARAGPGSRPEGPAGRADRPGLDLRPRRKARRAGAAGSASADALAALAQPVHPPIPGEEFEQPELLAVEKEAIGLFISAHPLKPLREALRARVDCPLAALADRRDKDWVTVGGIITEAKRIRTRSGDHMMFATLDDLAGAVEMLVFGKALAEYEAALAVDEIVLVQGPRRPQGSRQDVPGRAVASSPSPRREEEIERADAQARAAAASATARPSRCTCAVDASALAPSAIEELQAGDRGLPGPGRGAARPATRARGTRRLRLGEAYRVQHTPTLRAELEHALGAARRSPPRPAERSRPRVDARRARRRPRSRSSFAQRDFLARRALRGSRRASRARTAASAAPGAERNAAQPSRAELALADVRVAVAVGAERRLRVVEVQRARSRPRPSLRVALAQHRASCPRRVRMS